jgi:hypothetical protein
VTVIKGTALARQKEGEQPKSVDFTAVPYFAWDNRDAGEMVVWLPEDPSRAEVIPTPTLASTAKASASHANPTDSLEALGDGRPVTESGQLDSPRFTWWPRKGSAEWVQYDFAQPTTISSVEVYWFDDERQGRQESEVPDQAVDVERERQ